MRFSFEHDPQKSARNKAKHGIDFVEAQALWRGSFGEGFATVVNGEVRYLVIGKIGAVYWTAIITYRGSVRRIISVYRSNSQQIESYERAQPPGN